MIGVDPTVIGLVGVVVFVALLLLGTPIGIGMGVVGFAGITALKGFQVSLNALFMLPYSGAASWILSVIPMFVLMGSVAFYAGFTKDAYNAAYKWVGHFPGGLGVATLFGAAAFGACSGSSIAATAALGKSALPEMLRFGYNRRLAAGCVAMGGTLDALIPPSILLVIYGVVVEESIGKLLMAGLVPGLLSMAIFALLVVVWALAKPADAPRGEKFSLSEKASSLKDLGGILVLFVCVVGGLLSGAFTPTEAGAAGAFIIFVLAFAMGRLWSWKVLREILSDSLRVTSSIFLIVVGAYVFIQFLALTRLPVAFSAWVVSLPLHPILVLIGVILLYLVLGCFLDALGLILLTVPFMAPPLFALGFDSVWFGVLVVKLVEIGLITPPVGIQAYVLKGVAPPEMTLEDIFKGFVPFFIVDVFVVVGLIVAFPQISLFLPNLMK